MVKDRLDELLEKRKKRIWPLPGSSSAEGTASSFLRDEVIELECLSAAGDSDLELYLTHVAALRVEFAKIKETVDRIKVLQEDLFNSASRDKDKENELDTLMDAMKHDFRVGLKALKEMEATVQVKNETGSRIVSRIKVLQYESLKKTFNDQLYYYQQIELEHKERCKTRIKRMLDISNVSGDVEEREAFLEDGNLSVFTSGYQEMTKKARLELGIADARCQELLKIEGALKDLHSMFLEMSQLVSFQGEMIDSIERNVTNAEDITESANKQLENAQELQKKARKKKILIIIFLVILVIIIAISVYI